MLLEAGGVLECIPHDVDPAAKLTTAVIAMRRSDWWWQVPATEFRGIRLPRGDWKCSGNWGGRGDATIGEITWR